MSDNSIDKTNDFTDFSSYESYQDFCEYEVTGLTYVEFRDAMKHLLENKNEIALGFKPPIAIGGAVNVLLPTLLTAANEAVDATIDQILGKSANAIRNQAQSMRNRFSSKLSDSIGINDIGDGGDGGTTNADYAGGSAYNPTGLSLNLKPVNSNFQTNIVPLYRPKYFLDGDDATAPLLLKVLNVYPEPAEGRFMGQSSIDRFLKNAMTSAYVNSISTRLRPNSFTSGVAGDRKAICNYFAILSYALANYYSYASIISHFRMTGNRNDGMIQLYQNLSVADLNQIGMLGQILDGLPIDPRLNEFMFHLYGNYKQNNLPGSPLVKVIPFAFANAGNNKRMSTILSVIPDILVMLASKKFRDVQQVFASAYPELINTKVLGYSGAPEHDENWNTMWVNLPYYGCNSAQSKILPQITSEDQSVKFNLHTDAPDGWIEFASGMYNTSTDTYMGGLGAPKRPILGGGVDDTVSSVDQVTFYGRTPTGNTGATTAYIYRRDADWDNLDYFAFWPISSRTENQILSGNTHKVNHSTAAINSFQRYGTESAQPRTARESAITTQQMIEFMYYPPSMKPTSFTPKTTAGEAMDAEESTTKRKRRRRSRK